MKEGVLKIVRESIERNAEENEKRTKEEVKLEANKKKRAEKMAQRQKGRGPRTGKRPAPPCLPALIPAVEYVKAERKKAGLPDNPKEEAAQIEERLVRAELKRDLPLVSNPHVGKGADINSELDSYLDTQTFSKKIVYANWADRVAKELVEWVTRHRNAEELQPMKITEFFREKGIYHRDFYRLMKKYAVLEHALDFTLQALGDIRERNVLENKWNAQAGMFMMGKYDEDWRKETERREAAKVKVAAAAGVDVKAVIADFLTPVASTEEVRLKVENDKNREDVDGREL